MPAGQSALFDQLFSKDTRRNAGETGAAFALRNFTSSINQGNVAGLAPAISQPVQNGTPLLVLDGLPATSFQRYPQVLGALNVLDTHDYSFYHDLETQVERRFSNGLLRGLKSLEAK